MLLKMLLAHTSKDVTRIHLNGIYSNDESLIATDGHRLMTVRLDAMAAMSGHQWPGIKSDKIYEADVFKVGGLKEIDAKYPNYKQLIPDPDRCDWAFELVIPAWLKDVKKSKNPSDNGIGINNQGQFTTGKALVYFNSYYLSPYAGQQVYIYVKDHLSPILIRPCKEQETPPWQAVLMPLRGGPATVEVLREPKGDL